MKTSKKLLSFFLAVVMVVSSCSVGLTAFAKDNTDANRTYWNDASQASDAFAALTNLVDAYLPKLLANPAIKEKLETALGITITEKTTLSDLIAGVSPTIAGVFAPSKPSDVLGADYDDLYQYKYAYLNGDGNQKLSFYQLSGLCSAMKMSITAEAAKANPNLKALRDFSIAIESKLKEIKDIYANESTVYSNPFGSTEVQNELPILQDIAINQLGKQNLFCLPEYTRNLKINFDVTPTDGIDNKIEIPLSDERIPYKAFAAAIEIMCGGMIKINDPAEALYYGFVMNALRGEFPSTDNPRPDLASILMSLKLISLSGNKVSAAKAGDATKSFDETNYLEVVKSICTLDKYLEANDPMLDGMMNGPVTKEMYDALDPAMKAFVDGLYELYIYDLVTSCVYDAITPAEYTGNVVDDRNGEVTKSGNIYGLDFYSNNYKLESIGLLMMMDSSITYDKNIKPLEINDEQIKKAAENIAKQANFTGSAADFDTFLNGNDCPFSSVAKKALTLLNDTDKANFGVALRDLGVALQDAAKLEAVKAVASTDSTPALKNMKIIDRVNHLVPSMMCLEKIGSYTDGTYSNKTEMPGYLNVSLIAKEISNANEVNEKIFKANKQYNYDNYKTVTVDGKDITLTNEIMVDAVNYLINDKIEYAFGDKFPVPLNDIVNSLLSTEVDLKATLSNLWIDLYNQPVETIFNLAPLLTILIDELLVPIIFTENDTQTANGFNQILVGMLFDPNTSGIDAPLASYTLSGGNKQIGVSTQVSSSGRMMFSFNLNKILPSILDYILGIENSPYVAAVGTYGELEVKDKDGKVIPDPVFDYDKQVPMFTNILAADREIAKVKVGPTLQGLLTDKLNASALAKAEADAKANNTTVTAEQKQTILADAQKQAKGLDEIITTVGTTLNNAVKQFFADGHGSKERHMLDGNAVVVSQRGLNNLFVAVPQLVDYLGKGILDKYDISGSDWTATYDGKIVDATVKNEDNSQSAIDIRNSTNEKFKQLSKEKNGSKVLEQVLNIAIGNWLNGLIDYVNDIVSDKSATNKIVNELPLVFGLLDAIGGLGERSIISDIADGLFQLKRTDENSFAITEQPDTHYKGFNNKAGLFLISNLQFEANVLDAQGNPTVDADGNNITEQRGIIPLVMKLTASKTSTTNAQATGKAMVRNSQAPYAVNAPGVSARAASSDAALLSAKNVADANKLVAKLDTLLSTLLSDITLNGKNITDIQGVAGELAKLLVPYVGTDNANNLINIVAEYIDIVVNGKKYDSDTLSAFVVNTYSTLEKIIQDVFYTGADKLKAVLPQDTDKLVADAITGIISPDSVSVRMDKNTYANTITVLQDKPNLNWFDLKAKQDAGSKNVLKFDVNEATFFNAMAESFGGITALFGAILARTVTIDSTPDNIKNLYSEVYYPLMSGIFTGVMLPAEYNASTTTDSERLVGSFINPINGLIKSLFSTDAKPATALLNVVASLGGVLNDTSIKKIINGILGVIDDEITGFTGIVGNLSPTFQAELQKGIDTKVQPIKDKINGVITNKDGSEKTDIVINLVNSVLELNYAITLPVIDWAKLESTKTDAGKTLLVVFEYAVKAITQEPILKLLLEAKCPGLIDVLKPLTAAQIIDILNQILDEVQDPTEIYWAFTAYASELQGKFVYPQGILPQDATNAVAQLDNIVKNIFPLLKELGVLNTDSLAALLNDMAFTNANLTKLAKTLYTALNGKIGTSTITIADILKAFGVDVSPAGVAALLVDTSYGATINSAADAIKTVNNWNDLGSVNWGFTDGSAMAQTGFINGLAAILRPLDGILAMLLANGQLTVDAEGLVATISAIDTKLGTVGTLKNGVISIVVEGNTVEINLANTAREIANIINEGRIHVTSNAYESAIVPLLEAFTIDGFKTYKDYLADYKTAKDNLLLNILNPLLGFVNDVVAAPFDTLTEVLPNVALFIDGYGISQFLNNLLAPIVSDNGIVGILNKNGLNIDTIIAQILGTDLATYLQSEAGPLKVNVGLKLELTNLENCNIHEVLIPLVNHFLKDKGIALTNIDWEKLASHGEISTVASAAKNADGQYTTRRVVNVNKGETLIALLRYIGDNLVNNAEAINKLLSGIDGIKKNATLKSILGSIFDQISLAQTDDIIRAIFFFLLDEGTNAYFDYTGFTYEEYDFSFGNMDEAFCRQLGPMLDGLVGGMINLNEMITKNLYKDEMISTIATGLYKAVEGVNISKEIGSLTHLLSLTGIDFTTTNVADLLVNEAYGQKYEDAAKAIKAAGSWANVKAENLKWGVTDRDTFLHALAAVLRPVYGVLDVLLNNGSLNIFNLVTIPGSDGYTSFLVPLMEAFGLYNIKTQYQYREDIFKEYDNILLDVLNPLLDKVEDILAAPIETLTDILPNLALVFANGGLLQIINNLLTPVSAILNAIRPIVDANKLLDALNVDIPGMLAKVGIKGNIVIDVYDLPATLTPLLGAASVTDLLNGVLSTIKVGGNPLGIVLPQINWYQLASHGEMILDGASQVACHGVRISVKADQDETLIALLRFLVNTVNYGDNYNAICGLVGGLIGGADASVSDMVGQVLGMLQGDADAVIEDIVSLLQDLAG